MAISDEELFASLRARTETSEDSSTAPAPLGPDEIGAEIMGPSDVVAYCMKALRSGEESCSVDGCKTLLSFAVKVTDGKAEDHVGQLQPGFFSDPTALTDYLAGHPRYSTLTRLEEWKCMGTPDFSNMSRQAVQKLLVRRDGANWEDLFINMQLAEVGGDVESNLPRRRWLITSIYKQGTP